MNKNIKITVLLAFMLFMSMAFGPSSSAAFAKPEQPSVKAAVVQQKPTVPPVVDTEISKQEKCLFSPLKPIGPAPMTVTFYADYNGPDVKFHSWLFSDGTNTDSAGGSVVSHTFTGTNTDPQIIHQVWFTDGTNFTCSSWGKITVPNQAVTQTPPAPPVGGNTSPAASGSGCPSTILGDNNTVICGNTDMNNTSVTNGEKPAQPILNQTFGQIIGQAFADLIRSFIK